MWTELYGKAGRLCDEARSGAKHCPLIVRSTSEDVFFGNVMGTLKNLTAPFWLNDFLNLSLGRTLYRQDSFEELTFRFWDTPVQYPAYLLPFPENPTEVDLTIEFANPDHTIFVEGKYTSPFARWTTRSRGSGWFNNQVIRNTRVGLWLCGYFRDQPTLFPVRRRRFLFIAVTATKPNPLLHRYRYWPNILADIPNSDRLERPDLFPFVGEITYEDIQAVLRRNQGRFSAPERRFIDDLDNYISLKMGSYGRILDERRNGRDLLASPTLFAARPQDRSGRP